MPTMPRNALPISSPSAMPTETKSVGIWLRVSTEDQVKGESLEVHEDRARSYADVKGWDVAEVYRLEAVSGKGVSDHPETKRMLADIKSGHISALIFSKLARLSRNNRELLEFADFFKAYNADLVSLAESIDTSSPAGRMFYNMLASMANWEREEIAARVAASVPIRARMGKSIGGPTPFGYQMVNKQLEIDPKEAPIRELMYHLYKEHRRKKVVAQMLNDAGHRMRSGTKFSDTTVDRLLRDTTAKGVKRTNFTKNVFADNIRIFELKPESEWVYQKVPAIVSEELWADVVGSMNERRVYGRRQTKRVNHLFMGYTFCECGTKMIVPSNVKKYCCMTCKNKIGHDTLKAIFASELKGFVFDEAEVTKHRKDGQKELDRLTLDISRREQQIAKANQDMDVLIEMVRVGVLSMEGFKTRNQPNEEEIAALKKELPQLMGQRDAMRVALTSQEEVMHVSRDLANRFEEMPQTEQRAIVETIVQTIKVAKDEVEISFLFNPSATRSPEVTVYDRPSPKGVRGGSKRLSSQTLLGTDSGLATLPDPNS
jgi:site-specific DNA recombinase